MGPSKNEREEFLARLTEEDQLLVRLVHDLYSDNWTAMVEDLIDRQEGRTYVFELPAERLEDHLRRIDRLQNFELQQAVKLSSLLKGK